MIDSSVGDSSVRDSSVGDSHADETLRMSPQCDYVLELPVLGIVTQFESNSQNVIDRVEESFGAWRGAEVQAGAPATHPVVRIVVRDGPVATEVPAPVRHVSTGAGGLLITSSECEGVVDPVRGASIAHVARGLVAHRAYFRDVVLEAMTLALLATRDRYPVHAAGIANSRRAVLLAGPSGAGKSTLAYAAHRHGLTVLGDDRTWVQLSTAFGVWGGTPAVRLMADALARYPELSTAGTAAPRDGAKRLVPLGTTPQRSYASRARADVCLLARGTNVALERISGSDVRKVLALQLAPGFDRFPERQDAVWHALTTDGGWRLTLTHDPNDAVPLLQRMLDGV